MIKSVKEFWLNIKPYDYPVALIDEDGNRWVLKIATYEETAPPYHGELRVERV
jgi:hypothetical protein